MHTLITGGAGFIGSHLSEELLRRGDRVTVVDNLSTGRRENLSAVLGRDDFAFVEGSVEDESTLAPLVEAADRVVHLAAAVGVQRIVDQPVHTIETNIHGAETALSLADRYRRRILIVSTSEVYGKNTRTPFSEDDDITLGSSRYTRWSYACSKMVDEFLAMSYHLERGLETVVCRLFNTIGPRQIGRYGMVVPRFVHRAMADQPLEVYGDGRQSRCFCHVADTVCALVDLLNCDDAVGEVVNVGNDQPITMNELAERVVDLTASRSDIRHISYEQAYGRAFDDMLVRKPDLAKARRLIEYQPRYDLDASLRDVIAYFRDRGE